MTVVRPAPRSGSIFVDARGDGRALRVSRHDEAGLVVLSLWRDNSCVGTFRLPAAEVPELLVTLADALRARPGQRTRLPDAG